MSLRSIALSDFDEELINALQDMPENIQRKFLLEILVKKELESNVAIFSEIFTSKLNPFQKWMLKKWTGLSVSLSMFETIGMDTPESDAEKVIRLLKQKNNIK
jgi:hypothetical protein